MGAIIVLIGIAIVVGIVLYKNPEMKVKVFAAVGGLIAALGAFWDQLSGMWQ